MLLHSSVGNVYSPISEVRGVQVIRFAAHTRKAKVVQKYHCSWFKLHYQDIQAEIKFFSSKQNWPFNVALLGGRNENGKIFLVFLGI
jgi:hypothetical protein